MTDKPIPQSIEAEEAVCGSILIDGKCFDLLAVQPSDFYGVPTRLVFEAATTVYKRGEPIDQLTVAHELERSNNLVKVGGSAYIAHLMGQTPSSLDAEYYAEIVERTSAARKLIIAGTQIANLGYTEEASVDAALSKADELIMGIRRTRKFGDIITPQERGRMMIDRYTQLFNGEHPPLLGTGFTDIDRELGGGFNRGELVLLVADSGVGKSVFAHQIAIHHANIGHKVLYNICEMTPSSVTDREIASELGVSVAEIRAGHYDQELYDNLIGRGVGTISQREVYMSQEDTVSGIREKLKQAVARYGDFSTVVVDYLQLLEPPKGSDNRYLAVGDITRHLSRMAKEMNVLVILLCQLSRALEGRENKRPLKSDIYESKRPEQDADFILSLYRIDKYWDEASWADADDNERRARGWSGVYDLNYPAHIAEVGVLKDRVNGLNKIIKVFWDCHHSRYANLVRGV